MSSPGKACLGTPIFFHLFAPFFHVIWFRRQYFPAGFKFSLAGKANWTRGRRKKPGRGQKDKCAGRRKKTPDELKGKLPPAEKSAAAGGKINYEGCKRKLGRCQFEEFRENFPRVALPELPAAANFPPRCRFVFSVGEQKNFQLAGISTWPPPAVFRGNVIVPQTRRPFRFLAQRGNNQERGPRRKDEEKRKRVENGAGRRKLITLGRFEGGEGTRTGGEK